MIATGDGQATADGVLAHLWEHFPTGETLPGMLSVGLFQAWPRLDVPDLGWVFYQACYCDFPALKERAVTQACWQSRLRAGGADELRALPYAHVSRPLYPLDELDEMPLAAWAGDMVHPCHCAEEMLAHDAEGGCGGCGKCCGRTPADDD